MSDAERVAAFVCERVRARVGTRWRQGAWATPLGEPTGRAAIDLLASTRLWRVPEHVARALVAWDRGERDVDLLDDVPHPRAVLARQAKGRRCVSLLADDALAAPQDGALGFALHDLCHLEKFVEPEHHAGQVGFFATAERALSTRAYAELEASFDATFVADVEHVIADMNGSAVFLFAALKMKLKMAVRRRRARDRGELAPDGGPLSEEERAIYLDAEAQLLDLLELRGDERDAASTVSARRDAVVAGERLLSCFERRGLEVLACR